MARIARHDCTIKSRAVHLGSFVSIRVIRGQF